MYLAYIDESGSTGDVAHGGSKSYTLGCVVVRASQWAAALDGLLAYRRYLRTQFGLLARAEVKANHLLQNNGAFRSLALSEHARHRLYRGMLRLCSRLDLKVFAIVVRKEQLPGADPHEVAWSLLLRRLERLTSKHGLQVLIVHDEGDDIRVRTLARRARRDGETGQGSGLGHIPFRGLLDDPVSRRSHESLFLQLADLVAYAAFRRIYPPPPRAVQIVPERMWDELGDAALVRGTSGQDLKRAIVVWPRPSTNEKSLLAEAPREDLHRT